MEPNTATCGCPVAPREEITKPIPSNHENVNDKVTVKFKLDAFHIIAQVYNDVLSVAAVIEDLATKFKVDTKYIELSHEDMEDGPLDGALQMWQLPHNEFSIIELRLGLNDLVEEVNVLAKRQSEKVRLDPEVFYKHYQLPVFFSVQIQDDIDKNVIAKKLVVEIVSQPIVKCFLGGYRNTKTGIEYHDAFTQTGPSAESIKWDGIISRPTQTIREAQTSQDTHYDHSVQAFGSATELIYISDTSDYTLTAGKYETHHEKTNRINMLAKVHLIQRNLRRVLLQRLIRDSAAEWRRLNNIQSELENTRKVRLLDCFKEECVTKLFPKSREDFNMLIVQIHKWKQSEVQRINESSSGGPRIALLANLLNQEIQLLNAVEKKHFAVRKHVAALKSQRKLDKMGEPIRWVGYKNVVCEMDLLRTQKIRYLVSIYRDMARPFGQQKEQRLVLIGNVINVLSEESVSAQRNELIELLQREQNLLTNGLAGSNVEALRLRQNNMMVDIIHSYDRQLTTLPQKVPNSKLLCKMCKTVRPVAEFQLNTRQREANVCTKCTLLKNPPTDFTIYRTMLRSIRRDERRRGALASFAFIAQENDIRELIDTIWHGHSLLSQNSIHTELRLPRWTKGDDWSPWNCVCLTNEEAQAHMKLVYLEDLYDEYLIQKVSLKHDLARLAFKKMDRVNHDYVETLDWWRCGLNDGTV